jgi:hypothetical protein
LPETTLNCFCLDNDGRILAGCGTNESNGEIRVFEADGSYVESWSLPIMAEAVNVRASDGTVFVAGNGQLAKLSATGNLIAKADAPHVTALDTDALRKQVVEQAQQMEGVYKRQVEMYDQQVERMAKLVADAEAKIEAAKADAGEDVAMLEQQVAQYKTQHEAMTQMRDTWKERIAGMDFTLNDEQIDAQVKASIQRKREVASVSAVGDKVYLATNDSAGYGFSVWMTSDSFAEATKVVGGLRGCCGQMDVQASADGIYVAENARHRVACFDDAGELTREWGGRISDDSDLDGFGSCCNPMNLAFGPDGNVYTAEDNTGRIKCYTPDGKLLSHVGHADLVPGCKKVSIGVSRDGEHVYMLDITRNHIVHMQKMTADEATAHAEQEAAKQAAAQQAAAEHAAANEAESAPASQSTFGALLRVLTGN